VNTFNFARLIDRERLIGDPLIVLIRDPLIRVDVDSTVDSTILCLIRLTKSKAQTININLFLEKSTLPLLIVIKMLNLECKTSNANG